MSAALSPEPARGRAMPAWKRTILERKRAKLAGTARETSPGRGYPGGRSRSPSRKPPLSPTADAEPGVLQESIGPVRQNPFIRLEQERRRQQQPLRGSPGAATPIQQLLDMYSHVPGIRTIRAENILIIESDNDYFGGGRASANPNPLEELLARRGSKVTEIRASEVVIYEPLSRSHEDLLAPEPLDEPPGRVSRLRARFNQGKPKPQRSRSTDSLLDGDHYPKLREALPKSAPGKWDSGDAEGGFHLGDDDQRFYEDSQGYSSKHGPTRSMSTPTLDHSPGRSPALTPSSPLSSPGSVTSYSPSSPFEAWSRDVFEPAQETVAAPSIPSFKERLQNYTMLVNQPQPRSKLKDFSQKTGNNTITVNPRTTISSQVSISNSDEGAYREGTALTNGHASHSELETIGKEPVNVHDLLFKTKKEHPSLGRTSGGHRHAPPPLTSNAHELPMGTKTWRPKSEIDLIRSKFSSKPSAITSDTAAFTRKEEPSVSATPNQQHRVTSSTSTNSTFEIKPAPKPDLASIPDGDIQAKALANIRMQSKNSFVFIPKKRSETSLSAQEHQKKSSEKPNHGSSNFASHQSEFTFLPLENGSAFGEDDLDAQVLLTKKRIFDDAGVTISNGKSSAEETPPILPSLSDFDWSSGLITSTTESHSSAYQPEEVEYFSSLQDDEPEENLMIPVTSIHGEELSKTELPVTYIDDIVGSEDREAKSDSKSDTFVPSYRPHSGPSEIHFKGGNTFTIVPKRKPVISQYETLSELGREQEEDEEDDGGSKNKSSGGSDAPYSELGLVLKKRYPTVDEIEVIGGYMSLKKSCLAKNVSTRKKMKISFNESSLQTMFEYPSESSLTEDDPEEEDGSDSEPEEEEKPYSLFLPRPSFITGNTSNNSLRPNSSNSGLSSYTPKHSVEYSKWQEKKYEEKPSSVGGIHQEGEHDAKNMGKNGLFLMNVERFG
ncbi:taperin isoform X2 [Pleurodeles waltl]|uniref:taperin isoform X2 n=1 Tax=Pleurodeles waltl TaxID=8319 RepID=UPI003709B4B5